MQERILKNIKVFICITILSTILIHFGGMRSVVQSVFPERVFTIEDFEKTLGSMCNLEVVDENIVTTTSIASWLFINYQDFNIKNPVTLDYQIISMDEEPGSIPLYYAPSYFLQGIVRGIGEWHVELDYGTPNDYGLRLDFTINEGKTFEFGNFIINRTDLLVEKYLHWFDSIVIYLLFILAGVWITIRFKGKIHLSDLKVGFCILAFSGFALCGLPCVGYIGILGLMLGEMPLVSSSFLKRDYVRLTASCVLGVITIAFVCADYNLITQGMFVSGIEEKVKSIFVALLTFFVLYIAKGIVEKNKDNIYVKTSARAILVMLLYIVLDIVIKGNINSFALGQWLYYLRNDVFITSTIINILVIWILFLGFSTAIGVNWSTIIFVLCYSIIAIGNAIKLHFQGTLLKVADIFVLKEAVGIVGQYVSKSWMLCGLVLVVSAIVIAYKKRDKIKAGLRISISVSAVCFVPMMLISLLFLNNNYLKSVGMDNTVKYKQERESLNVFGTGLYYYNMLMRGTSIDRPEGYDQTLIGEVDKYRATDKTADINPNVILILAESLFRADKIPDVTFNYNLFEHTEPYIKGEVVSPSYGGRTAVAEAEALTGYSTYFLDDDAYVYTTYLTTPQNKTGSLAREFSASGYDTWAMHPNRANFYNRNVVYQCMGFDKFFSIQDYTAKEGDYLGDGLVNDQKFFDFLIQKLDESQKPTFIFGATIAGHSPYESKYKETEVKAVSERYSAEELEELSQYGQMVKEFDEQLGRFFDYLDTCGTPTLVYVFGDHLPPLKINASDGYLSDAEKKYTTPLIAYSNFSDINVGHEKISLSQVAPQIIMDAGIEHSAYFDFLYEFRKEHPILHKEYPIEEDAAVELYEKIQYDGLLGERYLLPVQKQ